MKKLISCTFALIFVFAFSSFSFVYASDEASLSDYYKMVVNDLYPDYSDSLLSVDINAIELAGYTDFGIFPAFSNSSYIQVKFCKKGNSFNYLNNRFENCDVYDFTINRNYNPPKIQKSCFYVASSSLQLDSSFSTVPFLVDDSVVNSGLCYRDYINLYHPDQPSNSVLSVIGGCISSGINDFVSPISQVFFSDNVVFVFFVFSFAVLALIMFLRVILRGRN